MMHKLIALSIIVGSAASVPLIYQTNPELFETIVRERFTENPAQSAQPQLAKTSEPARERKQLSGRRVEVPMDSRGHFMAEFKLNGRRLPAMIDTGATLVAFNETTARRVGIKLGPSDFRYEVNTANGTVSAAAARIDSLQIGRIHIENVEALVLEDKALSSTLIGMSFLKKLAVFRVEDGTMLMEQ
ncbi:TIGR02281 family clan AA aspartic protease [Nitratireductor sp. CAU 1489]|uniref:TIGR02281 family clan AA aspartic protease n=1 Tax=Nitratireductor arenosus TaxID=2682096 RepID=A0A844QKB5_9HYPH|nr:TIGR02281 family clan AA aspartic protease [Nitratireductor arenosus]